MRYLIFSALLVLANEDLTADQDTYALLVLAVPVNPVTGRGALELVRVFS
jgi:hypothetical protein